MSVPPKAPPPLLTGAGKTFSAPLAPLPPFDPVSGTYGWRVLTGGPLYSETGGRQAPPG